MPNPALDRAGFDTIIEEEPSSSTSTMTYRAVRMTLDGTFRKTLALLGILLAAATVGWVQFRAADPSVNFSGLMLFCIVTGFGLAWYTMRNPQKAATLAPIYAGVEGWLLGLISASVNARYAGLPMQAVLLTICTMAVMLWLYHARVIRATERFRSVVVGLTCGICMFYIAALGLALVGIPIPFLTESGPIGIGFGVFVTGLAAFNLILDFDLIEQGVGKAPGYMEWYAAFSLMVTLVWLYLEILRLMRKLSR
jgi:uncharacterized YccA/Bax inhibitor family protein